MTGDALDADSAQAAQAASLRMLNRVVDSLAAAVVAADGSDRIIYWSRGAAELFGREYDEVAGHEFTSTIVHRDAREHFAEELTATHRGEHVHTDVAIVRPDGERVAVVFDRSPVTDEAGTVVGWTSWSVDAADHR
ncbi:MAG: hypothetical protein QOG49_1758, partial [Frankiaceae bacterium]|nr:hypothetical protein [Frankiaceae bacterium]